MFVRKWSPLYAPDLETGSAEESAAPPPVENEKPSGPGSGRSSIRQSLERSFEESRKEQREQDTGRNVRGKAARGGREEEPIEVEEPKDPDEAVEATEGDATDDVKDAAEVKEPAVEAPAFLSKEAKAEWAKVPAATQAAILKREADFTKGVEALKGQYSNLDRVLAPRLDLIKRTGHQPHEAVNQLFAWFEALSANPDVAFPALAQSFNYDIKRVLGQPQEAAKEAKDQIDPAAIPPAVDQYVKSLEAKVTQLASQVNEQLGSIQNNFAQQSQTRTNEMLGNWAKDKHHFESVREDMARLIYSGYGLKEDGSVDLDTVYDRALYGNPQTRTQILQEQQAVADKARKDKELAERKAQKDQADKARRAGVGISTSAPGSMASPKKPDSKVRKSVRQSLEEARAELSEV